MSDYNPILSAPKGANKNPKRVGRGSSSGLGTTAGKGNKGQQSRSGGKTYVGFEGGQMPLYRRIARKGFSNYPFKKEYVCINVELLETKFNDGETVNKDSLIEKGFISSKSNSLIFLSAIKYLSSSFSIVVTFVILLTDVHCLMLFSDCIITLCFDTDDKSLLSGETFRKSLMTVPLSFATGSLL